MIATSAYDWPCIEHTVSLLKGHGYELLLFNSDEIANGAKQFSMHISTSGIPTFIYEDKQVDPSKIQAAWYRRPNIFGLDETPLRAYSLNQEYRELQRFFWDSIPPRAWFNDPVYMRAANNKLSQLTLARKLGFIIPETVVSNKWNDITALRAQTLTFKMPCSGTLYMGSEPPKGMGSTTLANDPAELPLHALPYPGLWQRHIPKKREWRVAVVGKQYFSTSIYTHNDAKDDWRKHQDNPELVQFAVESFPAELGVKCCEYVKQYGLTYGAFDFVEQPDGTIVFLEMNTNGQFIHLEGAAMPVSEAIANELAQTLERNRATQQ